MIPSYEQFYEPALRSLEAQEDVGVSIDVLAELIADRLSLTQSQRAEVVSYDAEPVHHARSRLAAADLARAGLVDIQDGSYRVTEVGRSAVGQIRDRASLEKYPGFANYRAVYLARRGA